MKLITGAGSRLAIVTALSLIVAGGWAVTSEAAKPSRSDAMAACRAKFGKKVTNVIINKDGSLTCQWQVARRPMTRAEAYDSCRKKFGPTMIMMQKTKAGWRCRYVVKY